MDIPRLRKLLGVERDVNEVARTLKHIAQDLRPASVGAMLQTCSDETECEVAHAFNSTFCEMLLPRLKFGQQAPFRVANLGGRYEWGAAALIDEHFTTNHSADSFKLIVLKLNAHVAKNPAGRYGVLERYKKSSVCCGALGAVLAGRHSPTLDPIYEAFAAEGQDRLAALRERVSDEHRPLVAAIVNARLQARMAFMEIQSLRPTCPSVFLVVPSVTLNVPERDPELVVGYYVADTREGAADIYWGLGDDPAEYQIEHDTYGALRVTDPHLEASREARDHQKLMYQAWRKNKPKPPKVIQETAHKTFDLDVVKPLLKTLVFGLAAGAGAPTALLLFSEGLIDLSHVWRAHHLAKNPDDHKAANALLNDFVKNIDKLPPEQAREVVEMLMREYGGHGGVEDLPEYVAPLTPPPKQPEAPARQPAPARKPPPPRQPEPARQTAAARQPTPSRQPPPARKPPPPPPPAENKPRAPYTPPPLPD